MMGQVQEILGPAGAAIEEHIEGAVGVALERLAGVEARLAKLERPNGPPAQGLPDPARGGFVLAQEVPIATAASIDDLGVGVHQGPGTDGVTLIQERGRQVLRFKREPDDPPWSNGGYRAEINLVSAKVGQGDTVRYVLDSLFSDRASVQPGTPTWNDRILLQMHGGSVSPIFAIRMLSDGERMTFGRKNAQGKWEPVIGVVDVPWGIEIREELEVRATAGDDGYAIYRLFNRATGDLITELEYEGQTLHSAGVQSDFKCGIYGQAVALTKSRVEIWMQQ